MIKKIVAVFSLLIVLDLMMAMAPNNSNATTIEIGFLSPTVIPGDYAIALESIAEELTAPNWGTFAPGAPDCNIRPFHCCPQIDA